VLRLSRYKRRDRKSAISLQRGHFDPKFQVDGVNPHQSAILDVPLSGLRETYDDHLRLIGKRIADFLLVLTELFSLGVTAEVLRANIGSKSAISLQ